MIVVDWGTSQLRAYRLDASGAVIDSRERPEGILAVSAGGFPAALDAITMDWTVDRVLMSGMVGSRQGWLDVPYVDCPAGLTEIARGVRPVDWRAGVAALICPGLVCRDGDNVPDVMRGEEVQVMGALALAAEAGVGSILMAGTHTKHVRLDGQRIAGFATHMTGEAFAVLKGHSILGRMMAEGTNDGAAFSSGVMRAREDGGLLHHLFGVRTRALMGELAAGGAADYLSGILIGHTIVAAAPRPPALVIGAPPVAERYAKACALLGVAARTLASERATIAGIAALDRLLRAPGA